MIMGKRFPGGPVWTVVLTHSAPGPFAQVRPPSFPMTLTLRVFFKSVLFGQNRRLSRGGGLTIRGHTTPSVETSHN
jgi:hypothetical protein